jgi:hypothetical protein
MIRSRRIGQALSLSLLLATGGGVYVQAVAQPQNATPSKPPAAVQSKRPTSTTQGRERPTGGGEVDVLYRRRKL